MKPCSRLKTFAGACALSSMLILPGCETIQTRIFGTKPAGIGFDPARSIPCEAMPHFQVSRQDTDGTIEEAIVRNRIIDRFCGAPAPDQN